MIFITLKKQSKKNIAKFIKSDEGANYKVIFNIMTFKNVDMLIQYFDPDYVSQLFGLLYKDIPIVVDVIETLGLQSTDKIGIKYVISIDQIDYYPNIQIQNRCHYWGGNEKFYTIRKSDTSLGSDLIFREKWNKNEDMSIVLNDFEAMGFKKAVALMSLCQSCLYYDDESYYMKCAVNPSKNHDVVFECYDYKQPSLVVQEL